MNTEELKIRNKILGLQLQIDSLYNKLNLLTNEKMEWEKKLSNN